MRYYAVVVGVNPGLYTEWDPACANSVLMFLGAKYTSFKTITEAVHYLNRNSMSHCDILAYHRENKEANIKAYPLVDYMYTAK